jgi:hypothetical protein
MSPQIVFVFFVGTVDLQLISQAVLRAISASSSTSAPGVCRPTTIKSEPAYFLAAFSIQGSSERHGEQNVPQKSMRTIFPLKFGASDVPRCVSQAAGDSSGAGVPYFSRGQIPGVSSGVADSAELGAIP